MFNRIKAAFMSTAATPAPAPVVEAPAKAKAARKPKGTKAPAKGLTDIQKATAERMAGWSLSGADKAQTEAFGKSFEATVHAFAKKENEASDSMRGVAVKLNVMLSKPGDNVHWSETLDEKRKAVNDAVRERFIVKYQEVKVARNGKPPTRVTVRSLYIKIIGLAKEEANFKPKPEGKGTGNVKEYATFALDNAVTAYKRGYRIPADKRSETDTTAMEIYGNVISLYKGLAGLKAVQKEVNDAANPKKGKGKASAAKGKGPTRKARTTKVSYPKQTKV